MTIATMLKWSARALQAFRFSMRKVSALRNRCEMHAVKLEIACFPYLNLGTPRPHCESGSTEIGVYANAISDSVEMK